MPGFVSPFEIMRTVRSAGFHPLSPPLREGTIYALRATDYRGIPMRVVLDARTGMIRNATPIAAQAAYGTMPPPYPARPYAAAPYGGPYGSPAGYEVSVPGGEPDEEGAVPPPQPATASAIGHAPTAALPALPLPRPRPAVLASKTPDGAGKGSAPAEASAHHGLGKTQSPAAPKQTPVSADQTASGPKSVPAALTKPPPVPPLTINN